MQKDTHFMSCFLKINTCLSKGIYIYIYIYYYDIIHSFGSDVRSRSFSQQSNGYGPGQNRGPEELTKNQQFLEPHWRGLRWFRCSSTTCPSPQNSWTCWGRHWAGKSTVNGPNSWTKGQKGLHGFPRASTSFYKVSTGLALSFHGFPIGIPQGFRGVGQGCSSYVFLSHFIRFFSISLRVHTHRHIM